jgi:hypothetical protein
VVRFLRRNMINRGKSKHIQKRFIAHCPVQSSLHISWALSSIVTSKWISSEPKISQTAVRQTVPKQLHLSTTPLILTHLFFLHCNLIKIARTNPR